MTASVMETSGALDLLAANPITGLDLRRFECLPGCGRCCAYKVSLLEKDVRRLEGCGVLREEFIDSAREPAPGFAGCMAKRDGHCLFLDEQKRCRQYEYRPLYCRLYPYIRESYFRLQLDVDLSCPGVGKGPCLSDDDLADILARDGSPEDHHRQVESQESVFACVEELVRHRVRLKPFDEAVEGIRSASESDWRAMREFLRESAFSLPGRLLPRVETGSVRSAVMEHDAERTVQDYLVLWSQRQALWRWADAVLVITPGIGSRMEAMARFLMELGDIVVSRAAASAQGAAIRREHVLSAVRECDSFYRTCCQAFRVNGSDV
jgi:Fe-S-cluster containining protein